MLLTALTTVFVSLWHGARVIRFRKLAGVPLPHPYATPEQVEAAATSEKREALLRFNCAQRAHYNFVENYSFILAMILVAGVRFPLPTAAAGLFWAANRVVYAVGYTDLTKKEGTGRGRGAGHYLGLLALVGLTGTWAVQLLMG